MSCSSVEAAFDAAHARLSTVVEALGIERLLEEDAEDEEEAQRELDEPSEEPAAVRNYRATELAEALGSQWYAAKGWWTLQVDGGRVWHDDTIDEHQCASADQTEEDHTGWTALWHQDGCVVQLRPVTGACVASLHLFGMLHPDLSSEGAVRQYGERKVFAVNAGPHAREGDHEGGEHAADPATAHGRRYAASVASSGCASAALSREQLLVDPPPPNRKWLLPVDHASCNLPSVRSMVEAALPAVLQLSASFRQLLPDRWAVQWASTRAAMTTLARFTEAQRFVTDQLGPWTNLAVYVVQPAPPAPAAKRARRAGEAKRQPPLGPHVDALNAEFEMPTWLARAVRHHRAEVLDVLSEIAESCEAVGSGRRTARTETLEAIRTALSNRLGRMPKGSGRGGCVNELTAIFNAVVEGTLRNGHLGMVVGRRSGKPMPKSAPRLIDLIIEGDALVSWIPLNHEALFEALSILHFGTPVEGTGVNARGILFATACMERTLGHFENCTEGLSPWLMNREAKREAVIHRALSDTSKPVHSMKAHEAQAGAAVFVERNAADAVKLHLSSLAELYSATDANCAAYKRREDAARSTLGGVGISPPPNVLERRRATPPKPPPIPFPPPSVSVSVWVQYARSLKPVPALRVQVYGSESRGGAPRGFRQCTCAIVAARCGSRTRQEVRDCCLPRGAVRCARRVLHCTVPGPPAALPPPFARDGVAAGAPPIRTRGLLDDLRVGGRRRQGCVRGRPAECQQGRAGSGGPAPSQRAWWQGAGVALRAVRPLQSLARSRGAQPPSRHRRHLRGAGGRLHARVATAHLLRFHARSPGVGQDSERLWRPGCRQELVGAELSGACASRRGGGRWAQLPSGDRRLSAAGL